MSPARALQGYGCAILSFMGGCQWGIAANGEQGGFAQAWPGYVASVVPALLAWVSLALPVPAAFMAQIAGLLGLLVYDMWTVRRGIAPGWYGALRIQLTTAAVVSLTVAAVL